MSVPSLAASSTGQGTAEIVTGEEVLGRMRPEFERRAGSYAHRPSALLSLLHAVQEEYGRIDSGAEEAVAGFLGIGINVVHEAVTFYSLYRTKNAGKYHIRVCGSISCELCGSRDLAGAVRRKLYLGEKTVTADGLFSLEVVECLGACDLAPAAQINLGPYLGPLTAGRLEVLIDEIAAREKETSGG